MLLLVLIIGFCVIFNSDYLVSYVDRLDNYVFNNLDRNSIGVNIMKIFTFMGGVYVPLMLIFCLLIKRYKKETLFMSIMYTFSGIIIFICKYLINRDRPCGALIDIPSSPSFPSGHSFTSMVFYFIFGYVISKNINNKHRYVIILSFVLISLMIGISRIYLGVHYFSDVIGGFILSIPVILIGINSYGILKEEK